MGVRSRWWVVVVLALLVAACGNSKSSGGEGSGSSADGRTGVSDTEIKVGGLAAVNNPLGGSYGDAFDGVQAYFDKVNAAGGIYGRKLTLAAQRDDGGQGSRDLEQARALVEEDKVFAVLPVATISFNGASYLGQAGVPTFGWNINAEWSGPKNLFGQTGSYLCFDCTTPWLPYLAIKAGFTKVGILTYSAPQSQDCAKGWENSVKQLGAKAGLQLVFEDTSLSFGFSPPALGPDLAQMKDKGVQFLATCIDGAGSAKLGQALHDNGMNVVQYLPNGYDDKLVADNAAILDGDYVSTDYFPIQADQKPAALQDYLDAMQAKGKAPNEYNLVGWLNAAQLVAGLKAAGSDFTRQKVVDAINAMTTYTADGILPGGIDWSISHTGVTPESCASLLQVQNGKLVPVYGQPGKPNVCFNRDNPDYSNPSYK